MRTSQTVRYVPHCGVHPNSSTFWPTCQRHSSEIVDFVYTDLKRLGRNANQSRLAFIHQSLEVLPVPHSKRTKSKAFRCIHGTRSKPRFMRKEGLKTVRDRRRRARQDFDEEIALLAYD